MKRVLAFAALPPGVALACSGPHAREVMERATIIGWACAALSIVFTLASSRRAFRSKSNLVRGAAWLSMVLCAIHPGIWTSAYIGDCGATRTIGSFVVLAMHFAAFALTLARR